MSLPVMSISQMREWEQATWATGQTEAEVIRRVGERIAHRVLELTRPNDFILLLAGKGHNGDDARAAISHLTDRRVELLNVTSPAASLGPLEVFLGQKPALVVDGLFGIGLNRPLDGDWIAFITRLRAELPAVRILAMSWSDTLESTALQSGADGFVRKTFRPTELTAAIVAAGRGVKPAA